MRTHNRVWLVVIAGGWALLMLTAAMTGGFHQFQTWPDYRWEQLR